MSNQAKCIMLMGQLMDIDEKSACSIMRECDMTMGFIRKGPNTVPDDEELEHLSELITEAIGFHKTLKD